MSERVIFLSGKRLYLRPLEETDLDRCCRWINDPEIRPFLLNQWPLDAISEKQWHEGRDRSLPPSCLTVAIVLHDGDRHIGNMGLHKIDWRSRHGETGTLIGEKECWGQGYGSEAKELLLAYAFDTLGLHRVTSVVLATNARSLGCQRKCGYVEEGRLRQHVFTNGQWVDEVILGILAEEWRARRRP